jgi:hypothetical protein
VRVGVHGSDGGVVRPGGGGETRSWSFPSQSLSNFSSFCRFLVLFAGCETMSGDGKGGCVWVGDGAVGAARVVGTTRAGQSGTAMAALLRLRRRRWWRWLLMVAAVVTAGDGR